MMGTPLDFMLSGHGSVFLLSPMTARAKEWVDDNLSSERSYFGIAVVVEHRFVEGIVDGIIADNLSIGRTA